MILEFSLQIFEKYANNKKIPWP